MPERPCEIFTERRVQRIEWRALGAGSMKPGLLRRVGAILGAVLTCVAAAEAAAADPPDSAASTRAQQLFREGIALVSAEKWAEAEVKFEQAWALNPSASTAANL